jgi:uncharacterized protein
MTYWLQFWWLVPIALSICVLVCLVGVEGSLLFAPFYAVVFPWLSGVHLAPLQAIQIGIFTEIFGFSSSFLGFFRAGLIDFRLGARIATVGVPAAVAGALLAYRLPQGVLLALVAAALPALAWYISHPPQARQQPPPAQATSTVRAAAADTVRAAAARIPFCCYASANLYTGTQPEAKATTVVEPVGAVQHRDRRGRTYTYSPPGGAGRVAVGAGGGGATGLLGFGIGVLGVAYLVIRRLPIRVAVGTSHFVILLVTGAAVITHIAEIATGDVSPPWNVIAVNAASVLVGGQLAAWLAGRLPEAKLRRVLVRLLLVLAVVTLYRAGSLLVW